jgi:hypothetical protein
MRERCLVILTLVNLGALGFTLADRRVVQARSPDTPGVLRGQALEIVDTQGRVRATIGVLPASKQPNGEGVPETVLLRLMTERGRPAIKISTSEEGSGFMAAGPTGTHQTFVSVDAKGRTASVRIHNEDGRQETVAP